MWRERGPATGKMTSLQAATLGASDRVAASLMESGGAGVALPCTFARRSRLLPEVFFDDCFVGRKLSSRVRAIIRELNETVVALKFLETGSVARAE